MSKALDSAYRGTVHADLYRLLGRGRDRHLTPRERSEQAVKIAFEAVDAERAKSN